MIRLLLLGSSLVALLFSAGCKADCTASSCPGGTFCDGTQCIAECVTSADCTASACDPEDDCCTGARLCNLSGRCIDDDQTSEACDAVPSFPPDGWDDPPGTGVAFIVNQIRIADQGVGANLDGRCDESGCIDNSLGFLGALVNDQLRQGLLGGEMLILIEITGLTPDYNGFDRSVTVRLYAANDADDPYFPANNFKIPPGYDTCCEFLVSGQSLGLDGQTVRAQLPARIRNGRIESVEARDAPLPIYQCPDARPELDFRNAVFFANLPTQLDTINEVVLAATLPVNNLSILENPYCKTVSPRCPVMFPESKMHDLIRILGASQPDMDIDGDGLECLYDADGDSKIDLCCDGVGSTVCGTSAVCAGSQITGSDPNDITSCRETPALADGYSVTLQMTGVPAKIVGRGR